MQAEMRQHVERATERLVARGMTPDGARLEARREFGNVTVLQEDARDARGMRWVDALAGDLRFAFRYFARNKLTTATIVTVLALGIGANTALFSAFQAEFTRPAPGVPRDDSHAGLHALERATRTSRWEDGNFSYQELLALREQRDIFRDIAGWTTDDVALDARDNVGARSVMAEFVTSNYFATLGVPLAAGGSFGPEQPGTPDLSAVMSFEVAAQLYGDATSAVGRQILVNQLQVRIVGIAPPLFRGAVPNQRFAFDDDSPHVLWIPLSGRAGISRVPARWYMEEYRLNLFARLAPDVSREQATTAARQVVAHMLPDSAARVGMTRSAVVLGLQDPGRSAWTRRRCSPSGSSASSECSSC